MGVQRNKFDSITVHVDQVSYEPFYSAANDNLLYIQIAEKRQPSFPPGNMRNQLLGNVSKCIFLFPL